MAEDASCPSAVAASETKPAPEAAPEAAPTPTTTPTPTASKGDVTVAKIGPHSKFVAKPFPYHFELNVRVEKLNDLGWGLGHVEPPTDEDGKEAKKAFPEYPDGWQVRVPLSLPGELIKVRIFKNMDTHSEADLMEVLEPSKDRVDPKCKLAGKCAGCQFQHMKLETQRQWKTDYVKRGLLEQEIVGYKTEDEIMAKLHHAKGTDEAYAYRSKLTPHYEAPIKNDDEEYVLGAIGFQQFTSRRLIDVEECPIATPPINAKLKETRVVLHEQALRGDLNNRKRRKTHRRNRKKEPGATLLFRHADDDEDGNPVVVTDQNEYMMTTVKGIKFRYQAGNFFQNNNYVLPLMVDGVMDAALAPTKAGVVPTHLIDCYCGSGLFALSASAKFELVAGIEVNEKAIEEATENAKMNSIENCHFVGASAEAIFISPPTITREGKEDQKVNDFPRDKTVVVLDPPRKGCSGKFLEQLYAFSPQRIVYMSCGPATQARDAKGIVEVGGYDIVSIQPFDLFPQTKHIECLMVFEKKEKET